MVTAGSCMTKSQELCKDSSYISTAFRRVTEARSPAEQPPRAACPTGPEVMSSSALSDRPSLCPAGRGQEGRHAGTPPAATPLRQVEANCQSASAEPQTRCAVTSCQRTASCQGAGMLGCADPAGLAGLAGLGSTLFPQVPTDSDSDATGAAARCRAATARRDQLKLRRRCKKYHAGRPE